MLSIFWMDTNYSLIETVNTVSNNKVTVVKIEDQYVMCTTSHIDPINMLKVCKSTEASVGPLKKSWFIKVNLIKIWLGLR